MGTQRIQFEVKGLPPSYNEAFKINYFRKQCYLSDKAKQYKRKVYLETPEFLLLPDTEYSFSITIEYWHNWKYKNGNIKRSDIQNRDKLVIDAVFERLGIDDSHVWENINRKQPSINIPYEGEDKIIIIVEVVEKVEKDEKSKTQKG